jgi:Leucine-rich repeat (LRR) protein
MGRISKQIGWGTEENLIYELIKETEFLNSLYPGSQPPFRTGISKQIGWSNRSNLYYEWLKEISKWKTHSFNCCSSIVPPTTTTSTTGGPTTTTTTTAEPSAYNFDVDGAWEGYDQETFELEYGVVVNDFLVDGNNLKANIISISNPYFIGSGWTAINYFTVPGVTSLDVSYNSLTSFDPGEPLSSTITYIDFSYNQITDFSPAFPLPPNLTTLYLTGNGMTSFNPGSLPSSLSTLYLNENDWSAGFSTTATIPAIMFDFEFSNSNMTSSSYTATQAWANTVTINTVSGGIYFTPNPGDVIGTPLETILTDRGWFVS